MSRLQTLRADGKTPDLPLLGPEAYLVEYLDEIGPVVAAGMGSAPIGWTDLQAWQHDTGITLRPWEARTLRRLSADYVAMSHEATATDCPPPYMALPTGDQRARVDQGLRSLFATIKGKAPRRKAPTQQD